MLWLRLVYLSSAASCSRTAARAVRIAFYVLNAESTEVIRVTSVLSRLIGKKCSLIYTQ